MYKRQAYNGEKFAVGYICWTNALEGVVELYRVTKDERYLALARSIAERTDRHPAQHSHGFLTTVRGVVALYRVTGEARYLDQAEALWAGVVESGNVLIQGAVPEMFAPRVKRDEGCSEADWLRLSLDLWEITRQPRYLEQAERTLFNELAMNQFHTGDYGHHTFTDLSLIHIYRSELLFASFDLRVAPECFNSQLKHCPAVVWSKQGSVSRIPNDGT